MLVPLTLLSFERHRAATEAKFTDKSARVSGQSSKNSRLNWKATGTINEREAQSISVRQQS